MYNLRIYPKAKKELKRIPQRHRKAIIAAFHEIKEDPLLGKPLIKKLTQRYSYRVGVYRIIYSVNKKNKVINVFTAGHRATVYN